MTVDLEVWGIILVILNGPGAIGMKSGISPHKIKTNRNLYFINPENVSLTQ